MRILHVNLAKGWGGGEIQTLTLLRLLAKKAPEIQSVLVLRKGGEFAARMAKTQEFPFVEVSHFFSGHFSPLVKNADLVHAHDGRAPYWCFVHNKIFKIPYLLTRRVSFPIRNNFITHAVYKQAACVVALTRDIGRHLKPLNPNVEINPSSWIDAPVDADKVQRLRETANGRFIIAHPAGLLPIKNHVVVLAAARILRDRGVPVIFWLLGKGPLERDLKARSRDLKNIDWLGHKDDISNYVSAADVVILPSLMEGLGGALLEAYHRGKPVIGSNVGGMPEVISSKTGFLHEPDNATALADAIEKIARDRALYERLKHGAEEASARYSPEENALRYIEIYRKIANP